MNETLTKHDTEPTLATRMNGTLAIHEMDKAKDNAKGMDAPRKNWWLPLLGILLVAAIVACWPVFHPLTKALTCGLGLTLAVAAVYWLARPRKKLDDALKESHYEKFQRLVGIYLTIPETVRNQPENAAAARSFETQGIFGPTTSNSRPDCALLCPW